MPTFGILATSFEKIQKPNSRDFDLFFLEDIANGSTGSMLLYLN
jgi:hypothetical protein